MDDGPGGMDGGNDDFCSWVSAHCLPLLSIPFLYSFLILLAAVLLAAFLVAVCGLNLPYYRQIRGAAFDEHRQDSRIDLGGLAG